MNEWARPQASLPHLTEIVQKMPRGEKNESISWNTENIKFLTKKFSYKLRVSVIILMLLSKPNILDNRTGKYDKVSAIIC
jgi:hypothetical protein